LTVVELNCTGEHMSGRVGWLVGMATLTIVATASCAIGAGAESPRSVRVEVRDLDFAVARDVERLYARIRRAARQVCEWQVRMLYLQVARTSPDGCHAATVSETVARLNLAPLIVVHRRAGGR
jgi:UrcA family protein